MTSDHCISCSVQDSALFLPLTEDRSATALVDFVREPTRRKLRIATWTRTMMGEEPETAVCRAYEDAVALLTELGHHVELIAPPTLDAPTLRDAFFLVAGAAIAGVVETVDKARDVPVQTEELEPFTWELVEHVPAYDSEALP